MGKWLRDDGSINADAFDRLESDLRAVTDSNAIIDVVLKSARLGRNMVLAFQCGHSGLYFPSDYIKEWGKLYGIGLGPYPVSEVLNSDYDTPPPEITPEISSFEQIMHPVGNCLAQVDLDLVDGDLIKAEGLEAILVSEDPKMRRRMNIVRAKQMENPRSRLRLMAMKWEKLNVANLPERR